MSYTYDININCNKKDFELFCKGFTETYPEYEITEKKEYSGSALITRFSDGENTITAELDLEALKCTIISPVRLIALEDTLDEKGKMTAADSSPNDSIAKRIARFFITPLGIKYVTIPLGMILLCAITSGVNIRGIFEVIPIIFMILLVILFIEGWLWLMPFIPLSLLTARSKSVFCTKAVTMSMPVFGIAIYCSYGLHGGIGLTASAAKELGYYLADIFSIGRLGFYDFTTYITVLIIFYIILLPYMILSDICTLRLKKQGIASRIKHEVIGWVYAVISVLVVFLGCTAFDSVHAAKLNDNKDKLSAAHENYINTCHEFIQAKYIEPDRSSFISIAEYALENYRTDWSECPEEELADDWIAVFSLPVSSEAVLYEDGDSVIFTLTDSNSCIIVYPYEDYIITKEWPL